jgi:hypothetical protein
MIPKCIQCGRRLKPWRRWLVTKDGAQVCGWKCLNLLCLKRGVSHIPRKGSA